MSNELLDKVRVLHEDNDMAAVFKPAGIMIHPDGRAGGPFLTDWVSAHFPDSADVGEPVRLPDGSVIARPGIVHRLDRETSGVMLVAKSVKGFECLKKQFQDRTIKKRYAAFVWGELIEDFGTIDRPIGRSSADFRRRSAQRGARGELREAETYWEKIKTFHAEVGGNDEKFTYLEAEPRTGRTHQIRAHFAAIQHPVVSDRLYAPKRPTALGFDRLALHAKSIEFADCSGKVMKITAPLPADFQEAVGAIGC